MAHVRRTANLREMTKKANQYILNCDNAESRRGIALFISSVMMDNNNYHGFQYQHRVIKHDATGYRTNHAHGITSTSYVHEDGCFVPAYEQGVTDDTMISFYWPI